MSKMAQNRNVLMSSSVITAMLFVCLSSFREKASRSSVSIKYYPNSVKPVLPSKHITENPQIDSWFYCCTLNYDYKRRQAYTAAFAVEGRKAYILFSLNPIEYYASFYVPISSDEQNVGHQRQNRLRPPAGQ